MKFFDSSLKYFSAILFIISITGFAFIPAAPARSENLDRIAAIVNDSVITQKQLNQQLLVLQQLQPEQSSPKPVSREQVLQHMIDTELQLQLIKKMHMTINDAELDQIIAGIAYRNHMTNQELEKQIEQQGMTIKQYRKEIKQQVLINQLQQRQIAPKITVSQQEIDDALVQLASQPSTTPTMLYQVEDLLIPYPQNATQQQMDQTLKEAAGFLAQARRGKSFEEIIQTSSALQSTSPVITHHNLGWRTLKDLPELFATAVQSLSVGGLAGPLKAPNGIHLIKLLAKRDTQQHKEAFIASTHVRDILIKTTPLMSDKQARGRLLELRDNILRGGQFAELAEKYSQDPVAAAKGGDLGWLAPGVLEPQFENAMNALQLEQLSQPFKTGSGWHLIQVLGRKKIKQNSQEFLYERAKQWVYQRKFAAASQRWLKELRSTAYVKILDN